MKSKKLKRTLLISSLSITSMLALVLSNSMFIHESNSIYELDSNISNELVEGRSTGSHGISKYSISKSSEDPESNSVTYSINYNEDGVWYWDQKKSDYNPEKWTKYASDQYYYGPGVSLGSDGDDSSHPGSSTYAPSFKIKYTGNRPSHEEWNAGPDGRLGHEHGGSNWTGGSKPTESDYNHDIEGWESEYQSDLADWERRYDIWEGYNDDDYKETIYDSWPNPSSNAFSNGYSGFSQKTSYNSNSNIEYEYTWNSYSSKMGSFPKLKKNWEYVEKDEGNWTQCTYDHWKWTGTPSWSNPARAETGEGNRSVYVDWTIDSADWHDSGRETLSLKDTITTTASSFANSQDKQLSLYDTTDSQRHSSNAPTLNVAEPLDSDWYGVNASKTFTIGGLSKGWTYDFHADLKYVDKDGVEQSYGEWDDSFSFEKTNTSDVEVWYESDNENSIKFGYDVDDEDNLRVSNIDWEFESDTGRKMSGESQSNHFSKSFDLLEDETSASFRAQYEYATSTSSAGTLSETHVASDNRDDVKPGEFYNNELVDFDFWVENIQKNSFMFTYYVNSNNNIIPEGTYIDVDWGSLSGTISNVTEGSHSFIVDTTEMIDDDMNATLVWGDGLSETSVTKKVNNNTNLEQAFTFHAIDVTDIRDHEATIDYRLDELETLPEEPTSVEYSLNNNWRDLDFVDDGSEQQLELTGLSSETEYEVQFKVVSNHVDYFSNTLKFTTDRSTDIYVDTSHDPENTGGDANRYSSYTIGEHSASFTFVVDKYEYIDNPEFTWGIQDLETEEILYEYKDFITHNGEHTLYADGLESNHEYRFVVNIEVEGEIQLLTKDIKTNRVENDVNNNSYITDIYSKKDIWKINHLGNVQSLEVSLDNGESWIMLNSSSWSDNDGVISVNKIDGMKPSEGNDITFMLNWQARSQRSYYNGIESTMIVPKIAIEINLLLLVVIILILFIATTFTLAGLWAWWNSKDRSGGTKIEGNIWKKEM